MLHCCIHFFSLRADSDLLLQEGDPHAEALQKTSLINIY